VLARCLSAISFSLKLVVEEKQSETQRRQKETILSLCLCHLLPLQMSLLITRLSLADSKQGKQLPPLGGLGKLSQVRFSKSVLVLLTELLTTSIPLFIVKSKHEKYFLSRYGPQYR